MESINAPAIQCQGTHALERYTDTIGTMKNAAAIDIKPDTDMDGIAGLTHENTVTLGGQRDQFPTAAFRVISKTPCNCENILRVGNGG